MCTKHLHTIAFRTPVLVVSAHLNGLHSCCRIHSRRQVELRIRRNQRLHRPGE